MKTLKRIKNIIVWKTQEFLNKDSWFINLCKYIWNREWLVVILLLCLNYLIAYFGGLIMYPRSFQKFTVFDFVRAGAFWGWFVWWIFPIYLILKNSDTGDSEYLYWYDEPILDWESLKVEDVSEEKEISFERFDHYK